ncbi:AraC family transcriptional regulator ligand-binding domain-containing protein [Pedobacter sp. R-06]|uniref:AraC family transcriptional regulator n=1 Tax=Pedobacter sp. R-06 TaxID=3404051 RepID=UPI003CFA57C8
MEAPSKTFISGLIGYAVQRDLPAEKLLRLSNLTLKELTGSKASLTSKQIDDVWLNVLAMSKDDMFGLHFGESLQLQALGIVGEIIKTSKTVGEALTNAAPLSHLITPSVELKLIRNDHYFSIRFIPVNPNWHQNIIDIQIVDLLMVLVIHELDGLLFKKLRPSSVSFSRSLDDLDEYERVPRCRPEPNAKSNQISFDIIYWDERIITSNHEHQKVLLVEADLWQGNNIADRSLKERVYNYIRENSYLKMISLEDIACNFNLSKRTLQRKLREEDINFQQLTDEARKNLALMYLKENSFLLKEISSMLGYNELSAFMRAFKRWTGMAPARYQKKSRGQQWITK